MQEFGKILSQEKVTWLAEQPVLLYHRIPNIKSWMLVTSALISNLLSQMDWQDRLGEMFSTPAGKRENHFTV